MMLEVLIYAKVWDRKNASEFIKIDKAHTSWVFHVQIDPARIVSASQDKNIVVWDFTDGIRDVDELLDI
jgi:WD40 repeat protein